ncbi:MAG: ATP-binding cassette domain-containing protein, partial [Pseudomonadota bacterium]
MSTPALRVEGLSVKSPRGRTILDLPALDVPAGTALGLRGASGAGKTTFIRALMGLSPGASGRVLWGERDLLAM